MAIALFYITTGFYSLATIGYLSHLFSLKRPFWKVSRILLLAGFLVQTAGIVFRYYTAGQTPITNRFDGELVFSWLLVAFFLILQMRYTFPVLGAFVTSLALGLLLLASLGSKDPALPERLAPMLPSHWFPLHVWFAFLGDALLGIAACFALMYLIQERQIKGKKIGAFYDKLPSLEILDRLSYRFVSFGFPCLTLGIVTGALWLRKTQGGYIDWQDGRQTATLLTWFLYAAILHGRLTVGWRGRRVAWMNVGAFLVILLTFLTLAHFMK